MPSAVSAFVVWRKEGGAPGSKSHREKVPELDVNPGKHQLFGCGGGGRKSSDFHLDQPSLEDLPTPHEVLALETPSQSDASEICCHTVMGGNGCPFTDG